MKKISFIRWVLILIATIEITVLAIMGIVMSSELTDEEVSYGEAVFLMASFIVNHVFFIASLVYVYHALGYFNKHGYFNLQSSRGFKTSGVLMLLSALVAFSSAAVGGFVFKVLDNNELISFMGNHTPIVLIGFGLLIIADFIKQAAIIEQENQLTI